jgi:hypothetical protein
MRETNIYEYYRFGYNYRRLRFDVKGDRIRGEKPSLAASIDNFVATLVDLSLVVTANAAKELDDLREKLDTLPEDGKVDAALAVEVREALQALDRTLDAELMLRSAYVVTPKRFDTNHLLSSPNALLGEGVYDQLSLQAQYDLGEACKCIAFERPTAAAFHLMRTVEEALRRYYCSIVKRGRPKVLLWGPMVEQLAKRRDAPPKPLLDSLTNIRVNFRNPTQHPEARYDMDEAQDLMLVSIEVLNRLIRDQTARA